MRLSSSAIELCRMKFGKGDFCGFEQDGGSISANLSEEHARHVFEELIQNKMLDVVDEDIHISALGQHIFNMMLQPEQYLMLDNAANGICVRIYVSNTYYLCVIEDKREKSKDEQVQYQLELLPRLDLVVGAFAYVLQREDKQGLVKDDAVKLAEQDIWIAGKAWDKDRTTISEIKISGKYHGREICCQIAEKAADFEKKPEVIACETSDLINKLTRWTFENISTAK